MPDFGTICVSLIVIPILAVITLWPQIYIRIFRNGDPTYNPRSAPPATKSNDQPPHIDQSVIEG
jgi:hypothetical protein